MVFLGFVEVVQRQVFDNQRFLVFFLLFGEGFFDGGALRRVGVIDAAAVLHAAVVALLVEAGRVHHAEVVAQDVV